MNILKPIKIIFFSSGNTFVSDGSGKQISKFQESWFMLYIKFLEENGIDPTTVFFELPNGNDAKVFKTDNGKYNWQIY